MRQADVSVGTGHSDQVADSLEKVTIAPLLSVPSMQNMMPMGCPATVPPHKAIITPKDNTRRDPASSRVGCLP